MNPDQLWETTLNPANRILLQVSIEDAQEADKIFDVLMGSEVMPRRKFIQAHAKSVQNIDIQYPIERGSRGNLNTQPLTLKLSWNTMDILK